MKNSKLLVTVASLLLCVTLGGNVKAAEDSYKYTSINGSYVYGVAAGQNYAMRDGYVGCPDNIPKADGSGSVTVKSIAAEGFKNYGHDGDKVNLPTQLDEIGQNAFYSYDNTAKRQCVYTAGAYMPKWFYQYFDYMGLTPDTPLKANDKGTSFLCDVDIKEFEYDGKFHKPENYMVYYVKNGNTTPLSAYHYITDSTGNIVSEPKNAGTYSAVFPVRDTMTGKIHNKVTYGECKFTIKPYNIESIKPLPKLDKVTYTGAALKPILKEIPSDVGAFNSNNFDITLENNINAGTATAIITGKNNLTGTVRIPFTITPRSLNDIDVTVSLANKDYFSGDTPEPIVKIGNKDLVKDVDYSLFYDGKENELGEHTIVIKGIGNYTNQRDIKYTVAAYKISYDLRGGTLKENDTNPEKYNSATGAFQLKNPIKEGYEFAGWTEITQNLLSSNTVNVTIPESAKGNLFFEAHWNELKTVAPESSSKPTITTGVDKPSGTVKKSNKPCTPKIKIIKKGKKRYLKIMKAQGTKIQTKSKLKSQKKWIYTKWNKLGKSKTIKMPSSNIGFYIQIRTSKKVGKKTYKSAWSNKVRI